MPADSSVGTLGRDGSEFASLFAKAVGLNDDSGGPASMGKSPADSKKKRPAAESDGADATVVAMESLAGAAAGVATPALPVDSSTAEPEPENIQIATVPAQSGEASYVLAGAMATIRASAAGILAKGPEPVAIPAAAGLPADEPSKPVADAGTAVEQAVLQSALAIAAPAPESWEGSARFESVADDFAGSPTSRATQKTSMTPRAVPESAMSDFASPSLPSLVEKMSETPEPVSMPQVQFEPDAKELSRQTSEPANVATKGERRADEYRIHLAAKIETIATEANRPAESMKAPDSLAPSSAQTGRATGVDDVVATEDRVTTNVAPEPRDTPRAGGVHLERGEDREKVPAASSSGQSGVSRESLYETARIEALTSDESRKYAAEGSGEPDAVVNGRPAASEPENRAAQINGDSPQRRVATKPEQGVSMPEAGGDSRKPCEDGAGGSAGDDKGGSRGWNESPSVSRQAVVELARPAAAAPPVNYPANQGSAAPSQSAPEANSHRLTEKPQAQAHAHAHAPAPVPYVAEPPASKMAMHLKLESETLGDINVRAVMRRSEVGASIEVRSEEARSILEAALPALARSLDEKGIGVGRVSVSQGAEEMHGQGRERQSDDRQPRSPYRANPKSIFAAGPESSLPEASQTWTPAASRISLMA